MAIYQQNRIRSKFLSFIIFFCYSILAHATGFDDWISTESCSKDANKLCHGYYRQPIFPQVDSKITYPVKITSEEASFVAKGTSVFTGNVKAVQGDKIIYSDKATVVHNSETGALETITATGNVRIIQPGIRVDGLTATAYVGQKVKKIDHAVYRLYERHARGKADTIEIQGNDIMTLCHGTYTTCGPYSNAWHLSANKTKFNKTSGRGEAWHAKLYVKDVPVFYWPYVNFPIDKRRQTGFLQPSYEGSSTNGATFILPFYWNIAPNYDATISSKYMSKRSWKFDNSFRYLTRNSNGVVNFDFLPHDREYRTFRRKAFNDSTFAQSMDSATALRRNDLKASNFRYLVALKNSSYFNKNWTADVDYSNASDGNYLYDFSPYNYLQNYALQRGTVKYSDYFGTAKFQLEQYRTFYITDAQNGSEQLAKLPELGYNSAVFDLPSKFYWSFTANYTKFKPKNIADNNSPLSYGDRAHARPALYYSIVEPGWFFKPRVQINYLNYSDLTIRQQEQNLGVKTQSSNTTIPMYDVLAGLNFERTYKRGYLQTLEPKLYYLYVPPRDQNNLPIFDSGLMTFDYNQVFRDNRYTGLDRISDANQVGMGLESKIYNSYGDEIAMFGIGQIYYFRNAILRLDNELDYTYRKWSPFAAVAKIHLSPEFNLIGNWVQHRNVANTASLQLQYRKNKHQVFNVGYEMLHDPTPTNSMGALNSDIKQVNVSTAWQITTPLRLLGRFNYDLRFSRSLDTLAGFEYHTCCTALRFLWVRTWEDNIGTVRAHRHRFRLQFIFKGFAGVGNAEDQYIASVIPGYQD